MAMLYNKLLLNDEDDEMKMCGNLRWTDDDDPNSVRVGEDLDLVRIHTNSALFIFEYDYVQVPVIIIVSIHILYEMLCHSVNWVDFLCVGSVGRPT